MTALLSVAIVTVVTIVRHGSRKEGGGMREPERKYEIDIFWSEEDGFFVACATDLEHCAAWGNTYEEALSHAHAAVRQTSCLGKCAGFRYPNPRPGLWFSGRMYSSPSLRGTSTFAG